MITPKALLPPTAVAHQVARHYDDLDPFYRALWGEHLHHGLWRTGDETPAEATAQLVTAVADRAQLPPRPTVCDVGCGYGGTARLLAERYHAQVIGLTLSPMQAHFAQTQPVVPGAPVPAYLLADWLDNPFPAQQFDAVIAIESTEHMADKLGCFAHAYRVLRPDGRLVVCAWLARAGATPVEARFLLEPICREGRLAGLGTAQEYAALMAEAGLRVEQVEDVSAQVRRTWSVALRRLAAALATDAHTRHYLLDARRRERIFAWTIVRLWLAYHTGALRYGIFTAVRPLSAEGGAGEAASTGARQSP